MDWLDIIGILYFIFLNDPDIFFLEYANGLDISLAGYYWNCSLYSYIRLTKIFYFEYDNGFDRI